MKKLTVRMEDGLYERMGRVMPMGATVNAWVCALVEREVLWREKKKGGWSNSPIHKQVEEAGFADDVVDYDAEYAQG